ncbi:MAG: T9SS type A sorting domain-containing protein [Gilvibacter sp.]
MKKFTLAFFLLFAITLTAQTTHNINWFVGASPGTLNIDVGDTVNWMWTDGAPHSVTSDAGSQETFDSGILPSGSDFSFTFTEEGTNPYFCGVHPSMVGTIEVAALGVDDQDPIAFSFYPNPVKDFLYIDAVEVIDSVQLYDISGKLLMDAPVNNKKTSVYMGVFKSGVYFVTVQSGDAKRSLRVILD